jgi:hypothetical protein
LSYPYDKSLLCDIERHGEKHHLVSPHVFPVLSRVNFVSIFVVPDQNYYRGCNSNYYSKSSVIVFKVMENHMHAFAYIRPIVLTKLTL